MFNVLGVFAFAFVCLDWFALSVFFLYVWLFVCVVVFCCLCCCSGCVRFCGCLSGLVCFEWTICLSLWLYDCFVVLFRVCWGVGVFVFAFVCRGWFALSVLVFFCHCGCMFVLSCDVLCVCFVLGVFVCLRVFVWIGLL